MFEKWRYRVIVHTKVGANGRDKFTTKGRIAKDHETGETKFYLKGYKKLALPVPDFEYIRWENGKQIIEFASPEPHVFIPIKWDWDSMSYKGDIDADIINMLVAENKAAIIRYQKPNKWDVLAKWLPVIIVAVVSIIMLTMGVDALLKLNEPAIAATGNMVTAADRMANATQQIALANDRLADTINILIQRGIIAGG